MSKKSRKKSSKLVSGGATAGKKAVKTRAAVKTGSAKQQRAPVGKSAKTVAKTIAKTAAANTAARKAAAKRPDSSKAAAPEAALTAGQKAPAFRLPRDGGGTATLADYAGRKLVLFFYPRADTPGCTREAIDFTRLADAFAKAGTAVLGISADPVKTQERFRDKHRLGVPLLSDETHQMLEAYGAWGEKSMYGKTFLGILRTTVLVGADGKMKRIWRNVRVDGHADEVLAAATGP
jgi:peroxiredoxin Q/BCP